jgi:hypothetical protein
MGNLQNILRTGDAAPLPFPFLPQDAFPPNPLGIFRQGNCQLGAGCAGCSLNETGISWPSHCRSTPESGQLRAHLSALMPYRVAAGVPAHRLPGGGGKEPRDLGLRHRDLPASAVL